MIETGMSLGELWQERDTGDFLRAVIEAAPQNVMEHDVEGMIGAGCHERGDGCQT